MMIQLFDIRARFRLAIAVCGFLLVCGMYLWTDAETCRRIVKHYGYWFTFISSTCFLFYLSQLIRSYGLSKLTRRFTRSWKYIIAMILLGCGLLFTHAEFAPKVMMDADVLGSTAKSLHESRQVFTPTYGREVYSRFDVYEGYVDKRPWLYPFLVSVLHDLSGFRIANQYAVNAIIGILMLLALSALGFTLGKRAGSVLLPLLWTTIPLFHQNATGGEMDLLNVFLLLQIIIFGIIYLRRLDGASEGCLAILGVLIAYCRYESVVFLPLVALLILWGWCLRGRAIFSWGTALSAPLLAGWILQNNFFVSSDGMWELHSGAEKPFGTVNIAENLVGAIDFFFHMGDVFANSFFVSILGVFAMTMLLVYMRCDLRQLFGKKTEHGVVCLTSIFVLIHFVVILMYHDGRLDKLFASRFALPVYLMMCVSIVLVVGKLKQFTGVISRILILSAVIYLIGFTIPKNAKGVFTHRNFVTRQIEWVDELLLENAQKSSMIIDNYSLSWTLREYSSIAPGAAYLHYDRLAKAHLSKKFSGIYLVDEMTAEFSELDNKLVLKSELNLEKFDLELIAQRSFRPFTAVRVYRIIQFKDS
ncbi:MAG: hypothetical protein ACSHYA_06020 [Opitutaceae bacterium]